MKNEYEKLSVWCLQPGFESATSWSKISLRNHYSGAPPNLYTWLIAMNETKSVILVRLCCDLADVTIQYLWSFYLD